MNWSMVAAIASIVMPVGMALVLYGRFTERVGQNEKEIGNLRSEYSLVLNVHGGRLDGHDVRLGEHTVKIAENLAWREGFNAGRSKPQGT